MIDLSFPSLLIPDAAPARPARSPRSEGGLS
ncbi:hypothetical protein QE430_000368 [Microbacterium testaceum]|nr:hypothetical protein [Microbacterium testaceum]